MWYDLGNQKTKKSFLVSSPVYQNQDKPGHGRTYIYLTSDFTESESETLGSDRRRRSAEIYVYMHSGTGVFSSVPNNLLI